MYPLYEAAAAGSLACFKLLAAKTRPANAELALHFASLAEQDSVLRLLLEAGPGPALFRRSPLHGQLLPIHLAAANKHSECLRSLYPYYNSPDVRDANSQDKPPLYFAVTSGHISNVRFLLERGADPGETDEFGVSLADLARASSRPDIEALLSKKSAVVRSSAGPLSR